VGASFLEPLVLTLAEQIAEAQRALALRRQCYPHGIRDGTLDSRTAYDQLQAMDAAHIDTLVFPTWAQLPAINGDHNTQMTDNPKPAPHAGLTHLGSSLTFVGSMLQWPARSVPHGYIHGLPTGLHMLARAWEEAQLIQYAYAYARATHYQLPPPIVPPRALPMHAGGHTRRDL
jgi:Asp-tRNA(Asn)/Glu-tRNA(Gln) amidotransferase A subunit family amidase